MSSALEPASGNSIEPYQLYRVLLAYYQNNDLYSDMQRLAYTGDYWMPAMVSLRNPAFRAVEFYVAHIWPGEIDHSLKIVVPRKREKIIEPITQFWDWSNWRTRKQLASRWFALYGDLFLRIATRPDGRPFMQVLDPSTVTLVEHDDRDFVVYVRYDVPKTQRVNDDEYVDYWHVEVWDKSTQLMRIWQSDQRGTAVSDLGPPIETHPFSEFGIDFIPLVHVKFKDLGDARGANCFIHAKDKIDEANRTATRLHQMFFRYGKPLWALEANMIDALRRPLAPPRIGREVMTGDESSVMLGDDEMIKLPGLTKMNPLVPSIDYDAGLAILKDMMAEIEDDLPELSYYNLRDMGEVSGRAVRLMLSDAVDRAIEARTNAQWGLIRADQMALTIGQATGVFAALGDYDKGDFDHTFDESPIIPLSRGELAEAEVVDVNAKVQKYEKLEWSLHQIYRELGLTEDEIKIMEKEKDTETEQAQAEAVDNIRQISSAPSANGATSPQDQVPVALDQGGRNGT